MEVIFRERRRIASLNTFFTAAIESVVTNCQECHEHSHSTISIWSVRTTRRSIHWAFREDEEVLSRIRALQPDIIWVGLSTPKQEVWMRMHMHKKAVASVWELAPHSICYRERHVKPRAGSSAPALNGYFD